jgi:hypothetical protein
MPAGSNFILLISEFLEVAENFVIILSDSYVNSKWCKEEWSAIKKKEVESDHKCHVAIIRITDCIVPPLLDTYVREDLHACNDASERRARILDVTHARRIASAKGLASQEELEQQNQLLEKLRQLRRSKMEAGISDDVIIDVERAIMRSSVRARPEVS